MNQRNPPFPARLRWQRHAVILMALAASLFGLGCWSSSGSGNYCQSGPKYGTQCYYVNERNEAQPIPSRQGPPPESDRAQPPPNGYR